MSIDKMLNKQREKRGSVLHFSPKQYNEGQSRFLMNTHVNTRRMEWEAWNSCNLTERGAMQLAFRTPTLTPTRTPTGVIRAPNRTPTAFLYPLY